MRRVVATPYYFYLTLLGVLIVSVVNARQTQALNSSSETISIRSGLTGNIGWSHLHIADENLPPFSTSEYFTFRYDLFINVGAMVIVDPGFEKNIEFVFDPSFSKYSYGGSQTQNTGTIISSVDVDMEALKLPLSVRYSLEPVFSLTPYFRAGGAFFFFIDTEAYFKTKLFSDEYHTEYLVRTFNYASYQNSIFASIGVELDKKLADWCVELVFEKGDGLHQDKYGSSFLKASNTTSLSLQFSVLF